MKRLVKRNHVHEGTVSVYCSKCSCPKCTGWRNGSINSRSGAKSLTQVTG